MHVELPFCLLVPVNFAKRNRKCGKFFIPIILAANKRFYCKGHWYYIHYANLSCSNHFSYSVLLFRSIYIKLLSSNVHNHWVSIILLLIFSIHSLLRKIGMIRKGQFNWKKERKKEFLWANYTNVLHWLKWHLISFRYHNIQ